MIEARKTVLGTLKLSSEGDEEVSRVDAMRMRKISEGARCIKLSPSGLRDNQRGQKAAPACVRALRGVVRGRGR